MAEPNGAARGTEKVDIEESTSAVSHNQEDVVWDAQAAHLNAGDLKLAKDGRTILVPQPSSDSDDPLNWSWRKKHVLLIVISLTGFLADFTSACGVPLILVQGVEWDLDPNVVNYAGNLNVAFLAIGGLFWALTCTFWGRAPVMFWTPLLGAVCILVTAVTTSFPVYYAFRTLTGFFLSSYQVVGLVCIKDTFYLHGHARKIGIWVAFFIVSPYLAPLFAYFILEGTGGDSPVAGDWRAVLWLVFAIVCLDLVLVVLFGDETYYDRNLAGDAQPARGPRLMRLVGVWQIRNKKYFPTVLDCCKRLLSVLIMPIVIPGLLYYMLVFMW